VEKTLTEHKQKLGAAEIGRIESALEAARHAVKGDDADAIRRATAELQTASHAMAEALYKSKDAGTPPEGSPDVKDAEVVDGEFAETR
jgi:molecular chaperone DnaK